MIIQYNFNYDNGDALANFEVDTDKFTPEIAKTTLDFYTWDYDEAAEPIDEVMGKYAIKAIQLATFEDKNTQGVIELFKNEEGFGNVDGSIGVTLTLVELYEFEDYKLDLTMNIKDQPSKS